MSKIKRGDRCIDCKHCKLWPTDKWKASCRLYSGEQGFHPDRPVPVKCINKISRKY